MIFFQGGPESNTRIYWSNVLKFYVEIILIKFNHFIFPKSLKNVGGLICLQERKILNKKAHKCVNINMNHSFQFSIYS